GRRQKVLYSFCAQGGTTCTDGHDPAAGLIMDGAGNLYSTTVSGGAFDLGTVFELIPDATKTKWRQKVLYSFCAQGGTACTDGAAPAAGLTMDRSGTLYGTTPNGGARLDGSGTVFELIPDAAKTKW